MKSVYEFENYRTLLGAKLETLPQNGYGQMSKLGLFIGVHPTLISQILKEHKSLSPDQAIKAAEFFGMDEMETEYFVLLVLLDRATNLSAKKHYKKQIQKIKDQSLDIAKRVRTDGKIKEEEKAVFYSEWTYSAVRQAVAIPGIDTVHAVAEYLHLPRKKVQDIVAFLTKTGLCIAVGSKIKIGPASTHVGMNSPWVRVHHKNWRERAVQSIDTDPGNSLHYTSPMTLSKKDAELIREKIIQFIEEVNAVVDPSPSEAIYCLNVDWF